MHEVASLFILNIDPFVWPDALCKQKLMCDLLEATDGA